MQDAVEDLENLEPPAYAFVDYKITNASSSAPPPLPPARPAYPSKAFCPNSATTRNPGGHLSASALEDGTSSPPSSTNPPSYLNPNPTNPALTAFLITRTRTHRPHPRPPPHQPRSSQLGQYLVAVIIFVLLFGAMIGLFARRHESRSFVCGNDGDAGPGCWVRMMGARKGGFVHSSGEGEAGRSPWVCRFGKAGWTCETPKSVAKEMGVYVRKCRRGDDKDECFWPSAGGMPEPEIRGL
ncbi:hypothetical protein LTR78_003735 [Recurvomyces mirabilis]|uniref:Uncharacterized protein n=1 Tax=Recurvomyces mirabilis TaxID=574656 RepID=A0AAE0WRT2_9PEZI|nr:hypothetical protein LTR78_003735 [Recurvomyces mirabilis]KAK5154847.1 hypothetical protein LTS14_006428 [Recurvomyces mirabilis]